MFRDKIIKLLKRNEFLYFFFEGISRGSIYLLLLLVSFFSTHINYLELISIISFETLITILIPTYYTESFFANQWQNDKLSILRKNISLTYIFSSILFLLGLVFIYLKLIEYNIIEILLLLAIVIGNILIKIFSLYLQSNNRHIKTIKTRVVVPLLTSVLTVLIFMLIRNFVLSYLISKTISYLFVLYSFRKRLIPKFTSDLFDVELTKFTFTSLLIGIFGWMSGIGFFKIANLFSNDLNISYTLAKAFNILAFLQFAVSGTNQLYFSKLSIIINSSNFNHIMKSQMIRLLKFLIPFFFIGVFIYLFEYKFKIPFITIRISYFQNYLIAFIIFSINIVSYVSNPIYYVFNKLKLLLLIQIISFIIFVIIVSILYSFGFSFNWILIYILFFAFINLPQRFYLLRIKKGIIEK